MVYIDLRWRYRTWIKNILGMMTKESLIYVVHRSRWHFPWEWQQSLSFVVDSHQLLSLSFASIVVSQYQSSSTQLTYLMRMPTGRDGHSLEETFAAALETFGPGKTTVYSDADQGKQQSSESLAFVWGIHRAPVNSPHKRPVTRKMFPFDDVIMMDDTGWRLFCVNHFISIWHLE